MRGERALYGAYPTIYETTKLTAEDIAATRRRTAIWQMGPCGETWPVREEQGVGVEKHQVSRASLCPKPRTAGAQATSRAALAPGNGMREVAIRITLTPLARAMPSLDESPRR
jgi:hypothetical protein